MDTSRTCNSEKGPLIHFHKSIHNEQHRGYEWQILHAETKHVRSQHELTERMTGKYTATTIPRQRKNLRVIGHKD